MELVDYFLFWDKQNDDLEILDEEGEFWFYSEDSVVLERDENDEDGRSWTRLEKLCDITPLNSDWQRWEVMDPITGEWVPWGDARMELIQQIQRHCGVKDWQVVV